ncbi:MAG TPA: ATP-binding protein [Candidatus Polarisedimenticolaceae bacterium]|nr:ATP-binding protein [Candidatus Polarisedimenticolaceae bacterium]
MTFRLVTLMSVVLLLSLAAFGLLMGHYQDQLLDESARMVKTGVSAALQTFEATAPDAAVWRGRGETQAEFEHVFILRTGQGPGTAAGPHRPEGVAVERFLNVRCSADDKGADCQRLRRQVEQRMPALQGSAQRVEYVVRLDEVRAESEPDQGRLLLTIPRFVTPDPQAAETRNVAITVDTADARPGRREDLRLPIPLADYQHTLAAIRSRSLGLFVGVFAVGTLLSAGLAARFTRPVRRLDAGIRRLSEGDLGARVEVRGRDEIARLGRAFNEMAARLEAARERDRELVRRDKLSALGRLAAGVAHDVRNPLHSIGLTLQHLRETSRPHEDERAAEFDGALELIRGEIRRLDQLVTNFLQFARSDRRVRRQVDLVELLHETARLVAKEAEWRRVRVLLDVESDVPSFLADGEALRASILNLVLNSFEAMPRGGTLTLALRSAPGMLQLEVADTGEGIAEQERERVFDFAYTTRESGSGLGLAMVHQCVVEEHGGRIALDSRLGEGTRVVLSLPLSGAVLEQAS